MLNKLLDAWENYVIPAFWLLIGWGMTGFTLWGFLVIALLVALFHFRPR